MINTTFQFNQVTYIKQAFTLYENLGTREKNNLINLISYIIHHYTLTKYLVIYKVSTTKMQTIKSK